jgi:anhydro-N-acetylmuramic acid kinase
MGNESSRLIAGAMSGTSADGVDVAITRITGRGLDMQAELVRHHHRPYDAALRAAIFQLRDSGQTSLGELARLGREISLTYALTVNEALTGANLKASALAAVAAHGQTLYHAPPDTIQWLDPSLIAAEVGCPVVSDFRRADCAVGGQGAPLVPFADYILFRHPTKNRVLLNIGGIANLTWLKAGGTINDVIAFDTGPGNCVSDYLYRNHAPQGPGYDEDGRLASAGVIDRTVELGRLTRRVIVAASPYMHRPPPKSIDVPAMIELFERELRATPERVALPDLLAVACAWTVDAVLVAVLHHVTSDFDHLELVLSGGGARNAALTSGLRRYFPQLITIDELGVSNAAKEALAFALLAAATLDGVPSNVPSVTGAKRAVALGSITPRP